MKSRTRGLVAATLTPLRSNGTVNLEPIPMICQQLRDDQVAGLYICGSTGEGVSLTTEERMQVAQAYVDHAGDMRTFVQVGHNSLRESQKLAAHAADIGADAISANCPSYFKIAELETLTLCMAEIASAAPETPFYYYHIPSLTSCDLHMPTFLVQAIDRIPNLSGLKYTDEAVFRYQECVELEDKRFEIFWGRDEMLFSALVAGAQAGIGSTYNIAAALYNTIFAAFETRNWDKAKSLQSQSIALVNVLCKAPFLAATKFTFELKCQKLGLDVELGPCRLPQGSLTDIHRSQLERDLESIGFFEWSMPGGTP